MQALPYCNLALPFWKPPISAFSPPQEFKCYPEKFPVEAPKFVSILAPSHLVCTSFKYTVLKDYLLRVSFENRFFYGGLSGFRWVVRSLWPAVQPPCAGSQGRLRGWRTRRPQSLRATLLNPARSLVSFALLHPNFFLNCIKPSFFPIIAA